MKTFSVSLLMIILLSFSLSSVVSAQNQGTVSSPSQGGVSSPQGTVSSPQGTVSSPPGSLVSTNGNAHLENPLGGIGGVNNLGDLFYKIIDFLISFSYIVIAFFLILSGFKFVKAQGSETELEDAKKTFYYTIIGAVILIGAQTITKVIQGIIEGLK